MNTSDDRSILAFHERDIVILLQKLDLLDSIDKGEVKCAICGKTITRGNLGAIVRKGGKTRIVCDDPACILVAGVTNGSDSK